MRGGLVVFAASAHRQGQTVFYPEIGRSDCERVLKQSEAIMPALYLRVRESSKNQESPTSYCSTQRWRNTPALCDVR